MHLVINMEISVTEVGEKCQNSEELNSVESVVAWERKQIVV